MNWFLQQVFCYEIFVLDYMFLYLTWVKDYSAHDCYYTGLERIGPLCVFFISLRPLLCVCFCAAIWRRPNKNDDNNAFFRQLLYCVAKCIRH